MNFDFAHLIYLVIFIIFIGGFLFGKGALKKFKQLLIWFVIFIVIFAGVTYKDVLTNNRILANLIPGHGITEKNKIIFYASEDGHFYINSIINGQKIIFLVDTGATDIVLNKRDAKKIGINPSSLKYTKFYQTANGTVKGANIVLYDFNIANKIILTNVNASVNNGNMNISLLGIKFLNSLKKYEVSQNKLTIYF
jgi:aspartyl protease family protein